MRLNLKRFTKAVGEREKGITALQVDVFLHI